MLGNFVFSNPTKLYFGEDSMKYLNEELNQYGENTMRKPFPLLHIVKKIHGKSIICVWKM